MQRYFENSLQVCIKMQSYYCNKYWVQNLMQTDEEIHFTTFKNINRTILNTNNTNNIIIN